MRTLLLPFVLLSLNVLAQADKLPYLIPEPVRMGLAEGALRLDCPFSVRSTAGPSPLASLLHAEVDALRPDRAVDCERPIPIVLEKVVFDTIMPDEWHQVSVKQDGITITAPSEEGLFRDHAR